MASFCCPICENSEFVKKTDDYLNTCVACESEWLIKHDKTYIKRIGTIKSKHYLEVVTNKVKEEIQLDLFSFLQNSFILNNPSYKISSTR